MPRKLLSLYVRAGVGATRLALKVTGQAIKVAEGALGFGRPPFAEAGPAPTERPSPADGHKPQAAPEPPAAPRASETVYDAAPRTPLRPADELAKAIDDQPELVEELAEPGAEEGAGAEIEVDEPWEGYRAMTADEILARIDEASAAELAVVELYEREHKNRQMVLDAAERRHKAITGPAAR